MCGRHGRAAGLLRILTACSLAHGVVGLHSVRAEEPIKEKIREALQAKAQELPPAEREQFIRNYIERARGMVDRQPRAALPAQIDEIPPVPNANRTTLPRNSAVPTGKPIDVAELNQLYGASGGSVAGPASDATFVRRVFLDVIGHLPAPADLEDYLADRSANRKETLVDRLLGMPQYGEHWGKYWADVVRYRASNQRFARLSVFGEVDWLAEELNANTPWSTIVTKILTAEGLDEETPEGFFVASHDGEAVEMAGEVARIFLGTQVACAQCHDHPYDPWKREQFHELAAFFGRTAFRQRRDLAQSAGRPFVFEVGPVLRPNQQYRMPDLEDPSAAGTVIQPVFLTGQPIPLQTADDQRRSALAAFVTSSRNTLFAKAFVNRVWYELVGFGFVEPIDDLGATRTVRDAQLFDALADSFIASGTDVRQLVRTIVLSDAYDRSLSPADSEENGRRPTRLSAPEVYANLDWVLGKIDTGGVMIRNRQLQGQALFEQAFGFDPSQPADEVEATISQKLFLMNSPLIERRIDSESAGTLLNKLLSSQHSNRGVTQMLYLRVLGRQPSTEELSACDRYVRSSGPRTEAFEDILWALVNTAEFLHQH